MNRIGFRTLAGAVAFAALFGGGLRAEDAKGKGVSQSLLQAKIAYCKTCHGVSGQGFRGSFPMPRLAGQQPEYIANQLKAFIEHRRNNPVMNNVTRGLSPAMLEAVALHFKNLDPAPLGGAPGNLAAEGKTIFQDGLASADVPPCASCHGEDAKGNGMFPRLAGQLNDYIISKLSNWDKERGQDPKKPDNSAIMQPITHNLNAHQVAAVAAYVSALR